MRATQSSPKMSVRAGLPPCSDAPADIPPILQLKRLASMVYLSSVSCMQCRLMCQKTRLYGSSSPSQAWLEHGKLSRLSTGDFSEEGRSERNSMTRLLSLLEPSICSIACPRHSDYPPLLYDLGVRPNNGRVRQALAGVSRWISEASSRFDIRQYRPASLSVAS